MNEHEATEYISRLVDTVPDTPAPLIDLLEQGERARRQRKGRLVSMVAAAAAVVITLSTVAATIGDQATDPGPPTSPTDTAPDPDGAVRVVMDWLLAIHMHGPKSACAFMTAEYQRELPAFNCMDPNAGDSPPFGIDVRDAQAQVLSQDGDTARVQITYPDPSVEAMVYITRYHHAQEAWLVAGIERSSRPTPSTPNATPEIKSQPWQGETPLKSAPLDCANGRSVGATMDWLGQPPGQPSPEQAIVDWAVTAWRISGLKDAQFEIHVEPPTGNDQWVAVVLPPDSLYAIVRLRRTDDGGWRVNGYQRCAANAVPN